MNPAILLVDDDERLIDGLRRTLRGGNLDIHCAGDAQTAMELLHRHPIDVVVSDDSMPGISGLEFLAQIRHLFPASVRIMLTGNATIERTAQAVNDGGVFRFLQKPCPGHVLCDAIRQALEHKLLMDRGREALSLIRRHIAILRRLSETHPEALAGAVDAVAGLHLKTDDFLDGTRLADEMEVQIRTLSSMHPALEPKQQARPCT